MLNEYWKAVPHSLTVQPPHTPHLPTPKKRQGAHANGAIVGANAQGAYANTPISDPTNDVSIPPVKSSVHSSSSASIVLSSLHSSEMSDLSYTVYSDESNSGDYDGLSEHTQSRESAMEEGRANSVSDSAEDASEGSYSNLGSGEVAFTEDNAYGSQNMDSRDGGTEPSGSDVGSIPSR